jgi:hypothetical protein
LNPDQSERSGILAGGNWIIDRPKIIDLYPAQDSLANTLRETSSNGGNPYNVLINLARYQAPFPLFTVGFVAGGGRVSPGAYLVSGRGFGRHLDARMDGANEPIGFKARTFLQGRVLTLDRGTSILNIGQNCNSWKNRLEMSEVKMRPWLPKRFSIIPKEPDVSEIALTLTPNPNSINLSISELTV